MRANGRWLVAAISLSFLIPVSFVGQAVGASTSWLEASKAPRNTKANVAKIVLDGCVRYQAESAGAASEALGRTVEEARRLYLKNAKSAVKALTVYRTALIGLNPVDTTQSAALSKLVSHLEKYRVALQKYVVAFESKVVANMRRADRDMHFVRESGEVVRSQLERAGLWACEPFFTW